MATTRSPIPPPPPLRPEPEGYTPNWLGTVWGILAGVALGVALGGLSHRVEQLLGIRGRSTDEQWRVQHRDVGLVDEAKRAREALVRCEQRAQADRVKMGEHIDYCLDLDELRTAMEQTLCPCADVCRQPPFELSCLEEDDDCARPDADDADGPGR